MRIAICMNTYLRPAQLREALRSLSKLEFTDSSPPILHVIVVNNDVNTSIEPLLADARSGFPWKLHGLTEPERGIPQARNCAVRFGQSLQVDYFAFIDDDEYPAPDWLDQLLSCAQRLRAPLVQGKVIPEFMAAAPQWAIKGRFFEGGRDEVNLASGQSLAHGATNNLLVRADVFSTIGYFDEWWRTQGGDDTEFTLRAARFGFALVWCPEAVVYEWVPAGRMNYRWILRRGFRSGNTYGLIHRRMNDGMRSWILLLLVSLAYVARTGVRVLPFPSRCRYERLKIYQEALFALGVLSGALGYKYLEYERPYVGEDFSPSLKTGESKRGR